MKLVTLEARFQQCQPWVEEVQEALVLDTSDSKDYDRPIMELDVQIDPLGGQLGPSFKMWTVRTSGGQPQPIRGISTGWPTETVWAGHRR